MPESILNRVIFVWLPSCTLCLIFSLGSTARAQSPKEKPSGSTDPITILMTSPRESELKNFVHLVEQGLLHVPRLQLVGLIHKSEWEDYLAAKHYVRTNAPPWIKLLELSCPIPEEQLFAPNECTPVFRKLFEMSDGVLFTGGPDIPPSYYGEETSLLTIIEDPPRDRFEISLLVHLLGNGQNTGVEPFLNQKPNYLVLGICRGLQAMNVATGGTLIQDIPSEIYGIRSIEAGLRQLPEQRHRSFFAPLNPDTGVGWASVHPILLTGVEEIRQRLLPNNSPVEVVSIHHQSIEKLGKGLEIWASSLDGKVIEAIRHQTYPSVLGVQFHPEKRILWDPTFVYREQAQSEISNFVATWFLSDLRSRSFHKAFWRMIARKIRYSAATQPKK